MVVFSLLALEVGDIYYSAITSSHYNDIKMDAFKGSSYSQH